MLNKMDLTHALILPMTAVLALPACSGAISSTASVSVGGTVLSGTASSRVLKAVYADLVCAQNSSCSQSPINSGSPITNAVATGLPAGLSISSTGVISGTPTGVIAGKTYSVTLTCNDGSVGTVTVGITVTLPVAVADHLVLVSGNNQSVYPGAPLSQSLRVQVQDQYNAPWTGGVTLGLMRMVGIDSTGYAPNVTTDSSGSASFPVSLVGASPGAWQVVPMGSTLSDSSRSKIGFSAIPTTIGNGTFTAAVNYTTAARPYGVTVGDFNGDGKADMALAAQNGNVMSVLIGNGDGTFAAKVDYTAGTTPRRIAQGDFNRDGKLDLVVSNSSSGTMSLFLGNGNGTFQAKVDYTTGGGPMGVAAGDFNGDGKLDLAAANSGANSASVFIGNGDGTFQAKVDYTTGTTPSGVAVGDFDGDGKLDLAVSNNGALSASVFIGNGDGTFKSKVDYSTGNNPQTLLTADLNKDGKLDLVVGPYSAGEVEVLMGNGDGTFLPHVGYGSVSNINDVAVADFNGDGNLDLAAVGGFGINLLYTWIGNGDGTFSSLASYSTATQPFAVAAGDFNGDHKIDLAAACYTTNAVSVFLGN